MSKVERIEVEWGDDGKYKGMTKIQLKGAVLKRAIEEHLSSKIIPDKPNQTREEALEEDIVLLKRNDKLLYGWARLYNLEQLIMCMADKIKKDHC